MRNIEIKTERLLIKPRTLEEMNTLLENEKDNEMKQAYQEMTEEMLKITCK